MNTLRAFFDAMSSTLGSGGYNGGSASFVVPSPKPGAVTKVCIAFKDTPEYLNLKIEENSCVIEPQAEPDAPDLTVNINKTVSEFRQEGLTEDDVEVVGLTNRKSTNSKIVNALDAAFYHLNGSARTLNGLSVL